MGLVDTGASLSAMSLAFASKTFPSQPWAKTPGTRIITNASGVDMTHCGDFKTPIRCGDFQVGHTFAVVENLTHDLIMGLDLLPKVGISLSGLPMGFPDSNTGENKKTQAAQMESALSGAGSFDCKAQIPAEDLKRLMDAIRPELAKNKNLPKNNPACEEMIEAEMSLPMKTTEAYTRQYKIAYAHHEAVSKCVKEWLEDNVTSLAPPSSFNTPICIATKKGPNGEKKIRVCLDFRKINKALLPQEDLNLLVPRINDCFARMEGFKVASHIDMKSAYNQLRLNPDDRIKTSFMWDGMRYMFNRWPFGLSPATGKFQGVMERVLHGIDNVIIFVDDILVYSKTGVDEHISTLKKVLRRLNEYSIRMNVDKCHFGHTSIELLGHCLSTEGRSMDPAKMAKALEYPIPTTGKQIQAFLGFTNWVRAYICGYSKLAHPLEKLRNKREFEMTKEERDAFNAMVAAIQMAPILASYDPTLPLCVATDASQWGVGAVLYQPDKEKQGKHKYIAFGSTSLRGAQTSYSATKRELLAIIFALAEFRPYLAGRRFTMYTDHQALVTLHERKQLSYMLQNWLDIILEYDFEIKHRPGVEMVLPDALSRLHYKVKEDREKGDREGHLCDSTVDQCALLKEELKEKLKLYRTNDNKTGDDQIFSISIIECLTPDERKKFTNSIQINTIDELVKRPANELLELVRERFNKQFISDEEERLRLIREIHATAHGGGEKLYKMLWKRGYYWPTMRKQCFESVDHCLPCQRYNQAKTGFHPVVSLRADQPMVHVSMDLAVDLAESDGGYKHLLVVRDVATRYVWVVPLKSHHADVVADECEKLFTQLTDHPCVIQTDNGREFKNTNLKSFCDNIGAELRHSAPWNPRANGLAERTVKSVKDSLKKVVDGNWSNWEKKIPGIVRFLNTSVHNHLNVTPYQMLYGSPCREHKRGQLDLNALLERKSMMNKSLKDYLSKKSFRSTVQPAILKAAYERQNISNEKLNKKRKIIVPFKINEMVMTVDYTRASKLEPLYEGPYIISDIITHENGATAYRLKRENGDQQTRVFAASQLKRIRAQISDDFTDAEGKVISKELRAQESFVVSKIMGTQTDDNGDLFYHVRWKGYPTVEDTWETADAFDHPSLITNYYRNKAKAAAQAKAAAKKNKSKKGRPKGSKSRKRKEPEPDTSGIETNWAARSNSSKRAIKVPRRLAGHSSR